MIHYYISVPRISTEPTNVKKKTMRAKSCEREMNNSLEKRVDLLASYLIYYAYLCSWNNYYTLNKYGKYSRF